jgi:phage antirepressor YoqD-like protein
MQDLRRSYIYIYTDPETKGRFTYPDLGISFLYQPFYIGKGMYRRMFEHVAESRLRNRTNKHKKILSIIDSGFNPKDYIMVYRKNLSEVEAYQLELDLIQRVGRSLINKGPLLNIHPGGRGGAAERGLKLSKQDRLDIAELYLAGNTRGAIATIYNVDLETISVSLEITETPPRKAAHDLPKEQQEEICARYRNGESTPQLGRAYGIWHPQIKEILVKHGVEIRPLKTNTKELEDRVIKEYSTGISMSEVGRMLGMNKNSVAHILRKNNIPIRSRYASLPVEVISLHAAGMYVKDIAKVYGVGATVVSKFLHEHGVEVCTGAKPTQEVLDFRTEVWDLYANGMCVSEISQLFNKSYDTIRNALRSHRKLNPQTNQ